MKHACVISETVLKSEWLQNYHYTWIHINQHWAIFSASVSISTCILAIAAGIRFYFPWFIFGCAGQCPDDMLAVADTVLESPKSSPEPG